MALKDIISWTDGKSSQDAPSACGTKEDPKPADPLFACGTKQTHAGKGSGLSAVFFG